MGWSILSLAWRGLRLAMQTHVGSCNMPNYVSTQYFTCMYCLWRVQQSMNHPTFTMSPQYRRSKIPVRAWSDETLFMFVYIDLTPPFSKLSCPILKLLQPLLTHTRPNSTKTRLKVLKAHRAYLVHSHVEELFTERAERTHGSVFGESGNIGSRKALWCRLV